MLLYVVFEFVVVDLSLFCGLRIGGCLWFWMILFVLIVLIISTISV